MIGVRQESHLVKQALAQICQPAVGKLAGSAATATHGVVVVGMAVQGKLDGAGAHVGGGHHPQFSEQVEGPVDRGQIDKTVDPLGGLIDIFGRHVDMVVIFHYLQDDRTLWRYPDPSRLQLANQVLSMIHGFVQ